MRSLLQVKFCVKVSKINPMCSKVVKAQFSMSDLKSLGFSTVVF